MWMGIEPVINPEQQSGIHLDGCIGTHLDTAETLDALPGVNKKSAFGG
jgi:hypothetical protein